MPNGQARALQTEEAQSSWGPPQKSPWNMRRLLHTAGSPTPEAETRGEAMRKKSPRGHLCDTCQLCVCHHWMLQLTRTAGKGFRSTPLPTRCPPAPRGDKSGDASGHCQTEGLGKWLTAAKLKGAARTSPSQSTEALPKWPSPSSWTSPAPQRGLGKDHGDRREGLGRCIPEDCSVPAFHLLQMFWGPEKQHQG